MLQGVRGVELEGRQKQEVFAERTGMYSPRAFQLNTLRFVRKTRIHYLSSLE